MRRTIITLLAALLLMSALGVALQGPASVAHATPSGDPGVSRELAAVRQATVRYHDLQQALDDNFSQVSPCVPGMGFHYLRSIAAGPDELDPLAPEILIYAPRPNGSLQLVAVEYASWAPAELFGRTFDPPHDGGPPFYTLHVWVWRGNPDGMFTPANPTVGCP